LTHKILAKAHKNESASNEDFLVDAQFHMALRVDAVIAQSASPKTYHHEKIIKKIQRDSFY